MITLGVGHINHKCLEYPSLPFLGHVEGGSEAETAARGTNFKFKGICDLDFKLTFQIAFFLLNLTHLHFKFSRTSN